MITKLNFRKKSKQIQRKLKDFRYSGLKNVDFQSWHHGCDWNKEEKEFVIKHNCQCDRCDESIYDLADFPCLDISKDELYCDGCYREEYYIECKICGSMSHPDEKTGGICESCISEAGADNSVIIKILTELKSDDNDCGLRGHNGICEAVKDMWQYEYIEDSEYIQWVSWFSQFEPKIKYSRCGSIEGGDYEWWFKNNLDRSSFIDAQLEKF